MITANAISKARAAIRSRGKMLVGQVRYPWIQTVGSSPKDGWASEEKLILHETTKKLSQNPSVVFPCHGADVVADPGGLAGRRRD